MSKNGEGGHGKRKSDAQGNCDKKKEASQENLFSCGTSESFLSLVSRQSSTISDISKDLGSENHGTH